MKVSTLGRFSTSYSAARVSTVTGPESRAEPKELLFSRTPTTLACPTACDQVLGVEGPPEAEASDSYLLALGPSLSAAAFAVRACAPWPTKMKSASSVLYFSMNGS